MTTVTTTLTNNEIVEPLEGLGTAAQSNTLVPQHALLVYCAQQVNAPGAGNNMRINFNYSLPKNYAYKISDFSCEFGCQTSADLAGFSSILVFNVNHTARAADTEISQHVPCNSWGTVQSDVSGNGEAFQRIYVPERMPSYPFDATGSFNFRSNMYNSVAGSGVCYVNLFLRLLAFDIQQYDNWALHTPNFSVR